MALSLTYATLIEELQKFNADDDTEFEDRLDTIIGLGETRALRDLDLDIFDVTVETIAFSNGNPSVTKPSGWLATRALMHKSGSNLAQLLPRSYDFIVDYWPNSALTGTPLYFTEHTETTWLVAPTPSSDVSAGVCRYMKRPTGLSSGNTTTWLGTNVADLLLYACMVSSVEFLKNDERARTWAGEYATQLAKARKEFANLIRK